MVAEYQPPAQSRERSKSMPKGIYPRCAYPEYKGRKCLCADCRPIDGVCISPTGCIECEGPVTECDPSGASEELPNPEKGEGI